MSAKRGTRRRNPASDRIRHRTEHTFQNTIRKDVTVGALDTHVDVLLGFPELLGFSSQTIRTVKFRRVGVQILPVQTNTPSWAQIGLTGPIAGGQENNTAGTAFKSFVAPRPPKLLSTFYPTYLRLEPTGPFQQQPFDTQQEVSDNNSYVQLKIEGESNYAYTLIVTTTVEVLPQTRF